MRVAGTLLIQRLEGSHPAERFMGIQCEFKRNSASSRSASAAVAGSVRDFV